MNFDKNIFLKYSDTIVDELEFIDILNRYLPNKIYNYAWSKNKPLYVITEYVSESTIKYYCNAWVEKKPRKVRLGKLYNIMCITGLRNFHI